MDKRIIQYGGFCKNQKTGELDLLTKSTKSMRTAFERTWDKGIANKEIYENSNGVPECYMKQRFKVSNSNYGPWEDVKDTVTIATDSVEYNRVLDLLLLIISKNHNDTNDENVVHICVNDIEKIIQKSSANNDFTEHVNSLCSNFDDLWISISEWNPNNFDSCMFTKHATFEFIPNVGLDVRLSNSLSKCLKNNECIIFE